MLIHEMTRAECLTVIAAGRLARLACARDNQPYVVPIYYAYDRTPDGGPCLYAFTTAGQKVEWMRVNPRVCVEWDEVVAFDQWVSVVAVGRYGELPGSPDGGVGGRSPERAGGAAPLPSDDWEAGSERRRAQDLHRKHATWWEPGCADWAASSHRDHTRPMCPLDYRISLDQVTVAVSRAKRKMILVAAQTVFGLFSPDAETFANALLWKNLLQRACPTLLWEGDRAGKQVQVWGGSAGWR